jgi:uncharacterized protein
VQIAMWHLIRVAFSVAAIAYLGLCAALFFFQRSLIYYPQPALNRDDSTIFALANATTRILVSAREKNSPRALLYFGGNAENVSFNMPGLGSAFPDSAIYLLHYRGYGGSSGKPSQSALFADALALFDEAHIKHADIEIVGRSLGSGIAVYVASQRPVKRLALVTPFDSLQEVAAWQFPYIPVRWLLRDKFESWRYAPYVSAPTLIMAAENDEVVPRVNTELLRSRFKAGLVSYRVVSGATHNSISDSADYMQQLSGGV